MAQHVSIAIDGPAGAGKSTVAKAVASRLGLLYVDTGAMYRAVAYLTLSYGANPDDESLVLAVWEQHPLRFDRREDGTLEVYADEECITSELRSPTVSSIVSQLSIHPEVRRRLTHIQRGFREEHGVVMDGRDIGTVVMPDADLKVFLTASLSERTQRRMNELENQGHMVDETAIRESIAARDERDASRELAPLKPATDARVLDSTGRTIGDIVEQIMEWVYEVTA